MENASNAMLMAASVLIGVLILGLVVIMFNRLSSVEAIRQQAEEVSAETEFNKQFESYNRKMLYGTDIISVANLIADYNERQGAEGYATVGTVSITLNSPGAFQNSADNNLKIGTSTTAKDIADKIALIEEKIKNLAKQTYNGGSTFEELKAKSRSELKSIGIFNGTTYTDDDFEEYMYLSEDLKAFKRKIFTCSKYETDPNTGRVTSMEFEEVNNTTP